MLAWIRTAASLITFGFSVSKFFDIARPQAQASSFLIGPEQFGLILVSLGLGSLALATWEYRGAVRELALSSGGKKQSNAVIVAGILAVVGILAFVGILLQK
jgi:putative membrane protein